MFLGRAVPTQLVIRSLFSYIGQDEKYFAPTTTVKETVRYAAGLRLPLECSITKGSESQLNLRECADTIISGLSTSRLSRGAKRGVAIEIQLLTNTHMFYPRRIKSWFWCLSSQIDLIHTLHDLGAQQRTVMLIIQQPNYNVFRHSGDRLLLACVDYPFQTTNVQNLLPRFSSLGDLRPVTINPADFALDFVTVDSQSAFEVCETSRGVKLLGSVSRIFPKTQIN